MLVALVLLGTGQARAEMIDFSYSWTVQPSIIAGGTGLVTIAAAQDGTGSYDTTSATATSIPGANITTSSAATTPPDTFPTTPFSLKLHLTDTTSGQAADLTFSGSVSGTLTSTSSQLTSTFNNPVSQKATLGNHVYAVTIDPILLNLPAPTRGSVSINALVKVGTGDVKPPPPPTSHTPEPSALLLSATAVLGLVARRVVRRRRGRLPR
jgi:hypothetical protein